MLSFSIEESCMKKGLLMVNTGDGKGKTTAALGLAMRFAGHGLKVCFIQFFKGSRHYGELESVKQFSGTIDFHVMGRGFTWKSNDIEKDKAAALDAWQFARTAMDSERYALLVLDEFTYLLSLGIQDLEPVLAALADRPPALHVLITGRNAPPELQDLADLVTEMHAVKHPFRNGITAQKGIEF
jgi:cob(I)alamin adenosyltransferase